MMDHVNIARVFDGGATESGRPYFVMELVHGVPITKYCDDNHLTPRERLELFVPVCQAIQHAHQKGIIHRDIKPSNVMVTLYDGKPVPKVIDFGVAKAIEQRLTERTLFTQYGTMVGTLEYMSPEQAELSALGVDTRSDIYSLGVLLYELLTGSTPLDPQAGPGGGLRRDPAHDQGRGAAEAEHAAERLGRGAGVHLGSAPDGAGQAGKADARRAGLDRDEDPGEGPQPPLRDGQRVRGRRAALPDRRAGAGVPAVGAVSLSEVRPPEPGRTRHGRSADRDAGGGHGSQHMDGESRARAERDAVAGWAEESRQRQEFERQRDRAVALEKLARSNEQKAKKSASEARSVLEFFVERVLAAARPENQKGGLGIDASIRAAVDAAEPQVAVAFRDQPLVEASIRNALGESYRYLGEPALAIRQHARARQLRSDQLGPNHPDTLTSMNNLALAYKDAGNFNEALPLYEETLEKRKARLDPDHPDTLTSMNNLAMAHPGHGQTRAGPAALRRDAGEAEGEARARSPRNAPQHEQPGQCLPGRPQTRPGHPALRADAGEAEGKARPRPPRHADHHERPGHCVPGRRKERPGHAAPRRNTGEDESEARPQPPLPRSAP